MRIISGTSRGKKILLPKDKNTRPLRDLVKESIFNFLDHSKKIKFKINKSNILDLFSGSGSFGLECVSRGAKKVTFIENYTKGIEILKKNVASLDVDEKINIINNDCFNYVEKANEPDEKYDLIFLDPPFQEKRINFLIDNILEKKFLNKDGIIIIHRHKKDNDKISKNLNTFEIRKYGISKIIFGK
tara:strand:- start:298 stop:858 length:561 start_codon:yes stop_codon:yes gene_type:complete